MSNPKDELTLLDITTILSEWTEVVTNISLISKENVDTSFMVDIPSENIYQAKVSLNIEYECNKSNDWVKYPTCTMENYYDRISELKEMLLNTHKVPKHMN